MSNSNGIISKPVSIDDVRTVLGESSTVLNTLCRSDRINKWSKHKPVEYNSPVGITDDAIKSKNFGLKPGVKSGNIINSLTKFDDVKEADWFYEKPHTFLRLGDFREYYHHAEPFIKTRLANNIEINQFNGQTYTFAPDVILQDIDNRTISLSDLRTMLNGYYYAVAIKGTGTNNAWREYKGGNILARPDGGVSIDVSGLTKGTYQVALYLSSSNAVGSGDMMPLPKDGNNNTWLTADITFKASFEIELSYVSKSLNGTYSYIDGLTEYYPMPASGTLYFKGVVRCITTASRSIADTVLNGQSDMFNGGTNTKSLHNCIYDESKNIINSIDLFGMTAGQEKVIYVKWDGYTDESEPEESAVIEASLNILYNYGSTSQTIAYIGGSPGFEAII